MEYYLITNKKNTLYFYYDKNRVNEIKMSESKFDNFTMSDIKINLDEEKFAAIVNKAKKIQSTMETYSK